MEKHSRGQSQKGQKKGEPIGSPSQVRSNKEAIL